MMEGSAVFLVVCCSGGGLVLGVTCWRLLLSAIAAAFLKWLFTAFREWPLAMRCCAKLPSRLQKFSSSFCFRKRRKLPTMSPL